MHLAGDIKVDNKKMRTDKSVKIKLSTLNGDKINKSLRFISN